MFENLIGWQIISMNNDGFVVTKDGKVRTFRFDEHEGDCCGYNDFEAKLFYDENNCNNPVITSVEVTRDDFGEYDSVSITFFGLYKPMAQINSYSSSGSGWCYGACVTCTCIETGEEEYLTSY